MSQYWSWRNTHNKSFAELRDGRPRLQEMEVRAGFKYLINNDLLIAPGAIREFRAELTADYVHIMKCEGLLRDVAGEMRAALAHFGLEVQDEELRQMEDRYSFRSMTKRKRGEEDRSSHWRKGTEGDWANYFDVEVAERFDATYGDVCDQLGYERATVATTTTARTRT